MWQFLGLASKREGGEARIYAASILIAQMFVFVYIAGAQAQAGAKWTDRKPKTHLWICKQG